MTPNSESFDNASGDELPPEQIAPTFFAFKDVPDEYFPLIAEPYIRVGNNWPYHGYRNQPENHFLRYNYGSTPIQDYALDKIIIDRNSIKQIEEAYSFVLFRIPLSVDGGENQIFLEKLKQFYLQDERRTPAELKELKKTSLVISTTDLLNFHLNEYSGAPKLFIDNIKAIFNKYKPDTYRGILFKETVVTWFEDLEAKLQENRVKKNESAKVKLNLNVKKGSKKALYYVIQQLYAKGVIDNSWSEIAEFLIQNVSGFENSDNADLAREISRRDDPMRHRQIDLPEDLI